MSNNETFKKLLQLIGLLDQDLIIDIFKRGGVNASRSKIKGWRTAIDNQRSSYMPDDVFNGFLAGLFDYRDEQEKLGVRIFCIEAKQ